MCKTNNSLTNKKKMSKINKITIVNTCLNKYELKKEINPSVLMVGLDSNSPI